LPDGVVEFLVAFALAGNTTKELIERAKPKSNPAAQQ
jgi:hypothetical protein